MCSRSDAFCLYPILVPHAITIKASNNREIYIIGEYVEDIEMEATYRQRRPTDKLQFLPVIFIAQVV